MKTTHLLATLIAATLPLAAIVAEDSGKTETADHKQEQNAGKSPGQRADDVQLEGAGRRARQTRRRNE